jgi:hypothetical protein
MTDTPKVPGYWRRRAEERRRRLASLLDDPKNKDVLNDSYFEALYQRMRDLSARADKVQVAQGSVLLLLMFALFASNTQVSLFGLSGAAKGLREALLIIGSSIQFFWMFSLTQDFHIRELLETHVKIIARGDSELLQALRVRFGLGHRGILPEFDMSNMKGRNIAVLAALGVSMIAWLLISVFAVFIVQIIAIVSILREPSFSVGISVLVIAYVLAIDVWTFGLRGMNQMNLPYEDDKGKPTGAT